MAQSHGAPPPPATTATTFDSTFYQEDGNLRHALMEFYLKNIASQDLNLDGGKMKGMAKGENWGALNEFLENKKSHTPLGDTSSLQCRKTMKKLRKTINYLSKYFQKFGKLVHIDAEVSLDIGTAIRLNNSVQVERGEIDAVFVLKDVKGDVTVIVIDWKRSLSNNNTSIQYECQCQVYLRCIQEEPSLVNLTYEQIEAAKLQGYLVEIGGDEGTKPELIQVNTDSGAIDTFLQKAVDQYESNEESPGHHCSSWCKWAFANDHCESITTDSLSINFHSDEFWQDLQYHGKSIGALVQFTISVSTILETGGKNVILFEDNRELHLKNINSFQRIEPNSVVRVQGSIRRNTPKVAYMHVRDLKVIE